MHKKIRRSTTGSWTMCTKVSRSTTEFMDNAHEGKQIYYKVHGQFLRRQADILQSSWPMCTKASRSTTEFIDMRKARSSSGISAERKKEQRQSSNNNRHKQECSSSYLSFWMCAGECLQPDLAMQSTAHQGTAYLCS